MSIRIQTSPCNHNTSPADPLLIGTAQCQCSGSDITPPPREDAREGGTRTPNLQKRPPEKQCMIYYSYILCVGYKKTTAASEMNQPGRKVRWSELMMRKENQEDIQNCDMSMQHKRTYPSCHRLAQCTPFLAACRSPVTIPASVSIPELYLWVKHSNKPF